MGNVNNADGDENGCEYEVDEKSVDRDEKQENKETVKRITRSP